MPLLETRGSMAAKGFGFTTGGKEPPGTYTFNNGFSGLSYQPKGWNTVTLNLYGSSGTNNKDVSSVSSTGLGSRVTKTNVPVSNLYIYCPNGVFSSQWSGGGNGGSGATASLFVYSGGYGGAVCAATWSGGTMVAAGGGGNSWVGRTGRQGGFEGTNYGSASVASSGSNGANGTGSPCYYGGGGGGGGYSVGGYGGTTNNGGNAGGNGASPSPTGTGSYGYDSISVGSHSGPGYATISWG